jgi:hypothetical protein
MGKSAAANWAARWTRGTASSVPDRSANRAINIGDTVSYGDGFGTGEVTHILGDESNPKYRVNNKYWDKEGVKKVSKKKGK